MAKLENDSTVTVTAKLGAVSSAPSIVAIASASASASTTTTDTAQASSSASAASAPPARNKNNRVANRAPKTTTASEKRVANRYVPLASEASISRET